MVGITGWRVEVSGLCNVFQIFLYVFKIVEKYIFDLFMKYLSLFSSEACRFAKYVVLIYIMVLDPLFN